MTTTTYRAASLFVSRCLRRATSLLRPRERLWTADGLEDLAERLRRAERRADDPRRGDATPFATRWQRTLAPAGDETVLLAAEVLYVHLLFPSNVGGDRKRALLAATLSRVGADLPPHLDAALDDGLAPAGVAYTRRRLSQLAWLAAAGARWRAAPAEARRGALDDPWRLAELLSDVQARGGGPQRSALLHLVHPETFPPVTSGTVRTAILRAFADHVPDGEQDPDRALAAVALALSRVHGPGFSFFDPEVAAAWQ